MTINDPSLATGVRVSDGVQACNTLTSTTPITIDGGNLTISGQSSVVGLLTLALGSLALAVPTARGRNRCGVVIDSFDCGVVTKRQRAVDDRM